MGAQWKAAREGVYMGDMCHTRAVGWATSISESYVMFMLCKWRPGGVAEGGEEEGEAEVYMAVMRFTQAMGCATGISELYAMLL